jgi:protein gp37
MSFDIRVLDEDLLRRREQTLSLIERPWNVVVGCKPVSDGCSQCFAHEHLRRFHDNIGQRLDPLKRHQPVLVQAALNEPSTWPNAETVVIAPFSDLFHADVPGRFIFEVLAVVRNHPRHFFQLTTRRPERMHYLLQQAELPPNLSIGIAAEDETAYAQRLPYLFEIKARWRHAVLEPLLEPVNVERIELVSGDLLWPLEGIVQQYAGETASGERHWIPKAIPLRRQQRLDWIILGGERGPKARPPHPEWVRAVRDACERSHVPFFFRGWGDCVPTRKADMEDPTLTIVSADGTRRGRGAGSAINWLSVAEGDVYFTRLQHGDEPIQFYLDGRLHRDAPDFSARFPKQRLADLSPLARQLQRLASGAEPEGPTTQEFIAARFADEDSESRR